MPAFNKRFTGIIRGGGDAVDIDCPECDSGNVIFEEYLRPMTADEADLGIKCEDCGHQEDPDEYGKRFEPTEPED
tara:strand:- start:724 stop:948 length:225 start_codon:yes stop_codon:yes gene_type:complete